MSSSIALLIGLIKLCNSLSVEFVCTHLGNRDPSVKQAQISVLIDLPF
jgi:hypothetical protein